MARGRRKAADVAEEPKAEDAGAEGKMDFELARKLYFDDIRPAASRSAEEAQAASTGYKAIKNQCKIDPQAAKLAFKVVQMESSKQQHFLRSMAGMFAIMNIGLHTDLVDEMQGHNSGATIIPFKAAETGGLATLPGDDEAEGNN